MEIDRKRCDPARLNAPRTALEAELRQLYGGMQRSQMRSLPVMNAYTQYYKRFKKTYHLLLQLDSICTKNKTIPQVDPLVQAMFMAELKNFMLTAGHDQEKLQGPVRLDSASGEETYQLINGQPATCKPGDMLTEDSMGVFCSIIYGQDKRTQITPQTRHVLYVTYVPPGIDTLQVARHLQDLEENVGLACLDAQVTQREIFHAHPADQAG
jgi:DNA/RNA-binding domain of Phe-tRNA-synthetase-like protein